MIHARNILAGLLVFTATACMAPAGPEVRKLSSNGLAEAHGEGLAQGRKLFVKGEYALAIEQFRLAIRDNPDSPDGYNALASSYDMIGRFDLAGRYYEMALAHAPEDGRVYRNMARSLKMQGRDGEAEALLAEWQAIDSKKGLAANDVKPEQRPVVVAPVVVAAKASAEMPLAVSGNPLSAPASAPVVVIALDAASSKQAVSVTPVQGASSTIAVSSPVATGRTVIVKLDAPAPARNAALSAIRIMNAGGRKGLARRMQTYLAGAGMRTTIGDADRRLPQSWIVYPIGAKAGAVALRRSLPIPVRMVADSRARKLILLLGQNAAGFDPQMLRGARRT